MDAALIHEARHLLDNGKTTAAIAVLHEHGRSFPSSHYSQEREFIRIEALARSGQRTRAVEELRRFRARYPKSLQLSQLESITGEPRAAR